MNTSRLTPQERVDYLVRLACDAWERSVLPILAAAFAASGSDAKYLDAFIANNRERFLAEARERMRQAATVWGCETES